ncbi:hypothetical protein D9756_009540 [Leucocoprinus leucothites]|uniref:Hydrophobin n=1 Tax=Leucocoprinus leucothites TaxID=201217 RepID=A0A8H5CWW7_9AGAR|nr:hypothetical protein D9756_009540 [Leucoagaricus leucothites]
MHFSTAFVLALPAVALATAIPRGGEGSCNTGPVQCCNQVQDASSLGSNLLGGLLGLGLGPITGLVGLNCNPISAIVGIGGNSCSQQPVCCSNNSFGGLVSLGCTPVNLNL